MKLTITRDQLYHIQQEILAINKNSPGLALLLHKNIKQFNEKLAMHLKITQGRFNEIKEKYVQKDDQGNFLTENVDGKDQWKYVTAKVALEKAAVLDVSMVEQMFNQECKKLFSQQISFDW